MNETEIKRYPFCGGKAFFREKQTQSGTSFWRIMCGTCGCGTWCGGHGNGYVDDDGKQIAFEEWNNRV